MTNTVAYTRVVRTTESCYKPVNASCLIRLRDHIRVQEFPWYTSVYGALTSMYKRCSSGLEAGRGSKFGISQQKRNRWSLISSLNTSGRAPSIDQC